MAGVSRLQYTTETRVVRVMCTGRVDFSHVIKAFSEGIDGVFIAGCKLNECNYSTHGNYHALNMVLLISKIMEYLKLNPQRLRIEFMSSSEGQRFAEVANDFVSQIKELGPIGAGEGLDEKTFGLKLKAVTNLVPYIRLVESERIREHFNTEEEYRQFYSSEEFQHLFQELIADKLTVSQIALLLEESPLSTAEMSEALELTPSEISRHLDISARQGLVRYEESQKRFALA